MKLIIRFSIVLTAILLFNNAIAAENIAGTWQGKLVVSPETELKIQFVISQESDGSYAVVLNSSDEGGIKDVKADSVTYDSGRLKLAVADLSGSYEGVVEEGKIEGSWMQEGTSMPLNLVPYVKPTLSAEDKEKLSGSWNGKLEFPGGSLTIVYRFEMSGDGELKGFLDSPDQGGFGIPVTDMEMEEGTLTVTVSSLRAEYKGKMAGDEIVGEFKQGPQPIPLTLKKGEYKAPVYDLSLSKEAMEKLSGKWQGKLAAPGRTLTMVFRFETMEGGKALGFFDSPDEGASGIPITDAALDDGRLTLKIKRLNAEYGGQLSGEELTGEWKQGGGSFPLSLNREAL